VARSRRRAKPEPQAIILPPDLDDGDDEAGSVIPDDDGWITLESKPKEKEAKRGKGKDKPG
jgi:hypothetical protein